MRRAVVAFSAILLATAGAAQAQTPYAECDQALITVDPQNVNICNAAIDGANIFHPVAGLLVSGGNPVLGSTRMLGGLGHFSFTIRANATKVRTPDLDYDGTGTTVPQDDDIVAPAPLVEAAIGLYKGMNGFLAIDLLGSAQLLPTDQIDNLRIDDDARKIGDIALGLGYGARVGVFQGRAIIPSVNVSIMRRDIPRITIGDLGNGDEYSYGVNLKATNLRAVAGYHLGFFDIGAGIGYDKYTGDAHIEFQDQTLPGQTLAVDTDLDNSRTMAFLTGGFDFPIIKIGFEAGYQLGKDQKMKTTFEGNDPADNRLFAGAGIRIAF
ncbi:MAG TPA: hypothetical protein VG817_06365 [Gemmatimonadales bacterium]|nr:hypothetical protein [Gemmatimonadales bacterium]